MEAAEDGATLDVDADADAEAAEDTNNPVQTAHPRKVSTHT